MKKQNDWLRQNFFGYIAHCVNVFTIWCQCVACQHNVKRRQVTQGMVEMEKLCQRPVYTQLLNDIAFYALNCIGAMCRVTNTGVLWPSDPGSIISWLGESLRIERDPVESHDWWPFVAHKPNLHQGHYPHTGQLVQKLWAKIVTFRTPEYIWHTTRMLVTCCRSMAFDICLQARFIIWVLCIDCSCLVSSSEKI